jgi:hypothetical protein
MVGTVSHARGIILASNFLPHINVSERMAKARSDVTIVTALKSLLIVPLYNFIQLLIQFVEYHHSEGSNLALIKYVLKCAPSVGVNHSSTSMAEKPA